MLVKKIFFISISILFSIFIVGCAHHSTIRNNDNINKSSNKIDESIYNGFSEQEDILEAKKDIKFMKIDEPVLNKNEYLFPNINFSSSVNNVSFVEVLYELSTLINMNIVFDENIDQSKTITLNFNNVLAKDALDMIMNSTKYHYEIKNNVIFVKKFYKKVFNINHLASTQTFSSQLGGDMFGGVSDKNGIKGDFSLKGEQAKDTQNFYTQLEKSFKDFLSKDAKYNINPQNGVIFVEDYKENVDAIEKIIDMIKKSVTKQILIEAKVLEVTLSKDYKTGIEWNTILKKDMFHSNGTFTLGQTLGMSATTLPSGSIQYTNNNFNGLITAINQSGNVKTVSNPRLMVMNGQSALITSGKIVPYWEKEVTTSNNGTSQPTSEVTYNRRDVLDGISLGVTPVINEKNEIILNVVPILTSIDVDKEYSDNGNVVASAPILNIKNLGTTIKSKNNDMVVIGGLINEKLLNKDKGIPYLDKIPVVGEAAFNQVDDNFEKKELVIILRIKVLN